MGKEKEENSYRHRNLFQMGEEGETVKGGGGTSMGSLGLKFLFLS